MDRKRARSPYSDRDGQDVRRFEKRQRTAERSSSDTETPIQSRQDTRSQGLHNGAQSLDGAQPAHGAHENPQPQGHHGEVQKSDGPVENRFALVPGPVQCSEGRDYQEKKWLGMKEKTTYMDIDQQKLRLEAEQFCMLPRHLNVATKTELARWVACKREVALWGSEDRKDFLRNLSQCETLKPEDEEEDSDDECVCAYCTGTYGWKKHDQDAFIITWYWSRGIMKEAGYLKIEDSEDVSTPRDELVREATAKGINVEEMELEHKNREAMKALTSDHRMSREYLEGLPTDELRRLAEKRRIRTLSLQDFDIIWRILHVGQTTGKTDGTKLLTQAEAEAAAFVRPPASGYKPVHTNPVATKKPAPAINHGKVVQTDKPDSERRDVPAQTRDASIHTEPVGPEPRNPEIVATEHGGIEPGDAGQTNNGQEIVDLEAIQETEQQNVDLEDVETEDAAIIDTTTKRVMKPPRDKFRKQRPLQKILFAKMKRQADASEAHVPQPAEPAATAASAAEQPQTATEPRGKKRARAEADVAEEPRRSKRLRDKQQTAPAPAPTPAPRAADNVVAPAPAPPAPDDNIASRVGKRRLPKDPEVKKPPPAKRQKKVPVVPAVQQTPAVDGPAGRLRPRKRKEPEVEKERPPPAKRGRRRK
ncbi:hypothetical protein K491DRAFT_674153 [Lophiostoma macrostomum CBS 122681]|uniref:Uncharacterized protein n=1 Tax=Lophiostoma macrostomum CBS 122681 TaxID=1314788 RepID=A0A6A6TRB9_9PLEO|nr:hypothetical protein K491DRAFT_674153 [Lophiostoma macrostomum CBS 122681]